MAEKWVVFGHHIMLGIRSVASCADRLLPDAKRLVAEANAGSALAEAVRESLQWSPYKGESEETPFLRRARKALADWDAASKERA